MSHTPKDDAIDQIELTGPIYLPFTSSDAPQRQAPQQQQTGGRRLRYIS